MSTPNPFLPTYQDRQKKTIVAERKNEMLANSLGGILKQVYNNNIHGYMKMLNLIANGKSASIDDLASAFQYPSFLLKTYFYFNSSAAANFDFDPEGKIIGIGLTQKPTKHHFTIRENPLYTWCALDTLLFPLMLNESAQVKTPCPITGAEIAFSISPSGIKDLNAGDAVVLLLFLIREKQKIIFENLFVILPISLKTVKQLLSGKHNIHKLLFYLSMKHSNLLKKWCLL